MRRGLSSILLCVPLLAVLATGVAAQTVVTGDWPLKPSGLSAGDRFRLMFITSTMRDATSTNIADYNSFVQARAAAGHMSIRSHSAQFRAVGSTAAVDARDNTMTTGTGVPIYWLGGAKVADDYADFYDGTTWDSIAARNESGGSIDGGFFLLEVWSGSASDGTEAFLSGSTTSLALGSTFVQGGNESTLSSDISGSSASKSLYALSPVFEVGQQLTSLSISAPADANEGDYPGTRDLTFTVTLGTAVSQDVNFKVCFTGTATIGTTGSFAQGDDYLPLAAGNPQSSNCVDAAVPGGTTSSTAVDIRVRGDHRVEQDESVTATLSFRGTPPADVSLGTSTVVTHTIRNDDTRGVFYFKAWPGKTVTINNQDGTTSNITQPDSIASSGHVREGSSITYTVLRGQQFGAASVDYRTMDGSAKAPGDYTHVSGTLHWTHRDTDAKTITIQTVCDDVEHDGAEQFWLILSNPTGGYSLTSTNRYYPHRSRVVIGRVPVSECPTSSEQVLPGGTPSEVTIAADLTSVTEGGDVTFTVTANPAPAGDLVVNVSADEEMGSGGDLVAGGHSGTVTIWAGTASATWTVTTMSDDDALADGTVVGRIVSGDNYTVGTPSEVTVTLLDDDGVTTQSVPDSVVTDPATPGVDAALVAEVTAKADGHSNPDAAARLRRIVKGMTGEDGGYTAEECRETATRHGVLSTWKPWCDEIARREAQAPPVPQQQQQVITLPAVSVSAGADVTEGGDAVFTVTASPAPASPLSVTVTVAASGEFGVTAGTQTVPIPVTGSATLTLATANDGADEPDGSVSVTVAAGNGYTVGDPAAGTVAIADDDVSLPAIAVSAGADVTEGGDATFTVTASPAPALSLAVSVTVAAKGDYGIASGTQTVSIPTTGSATLTLATANDDADEPNGSASVTVAAGEGYTVGSPASGSVSIADDDLPPPVVSIAATAASVTEGGAAAFTLTADRAPDADLTVTLSVAETGGGDHVAAADEGPATAVIAKGKTEAVFSVATVDDDVDEPDGSVTVTLKDGGGYTVPSPPGNAAAVTVSDNDAAALPSLSVADVTVKEGAWMEFTVRLSAPSAGGVSVTVSTRDSTPVSATTRDYWPISGRTVSFRAGETERSVGVIVFDDSHDEEPETFEVVLSDARGAAIADGVAVGTITNDDPMPAAWLARFGRTVAEQALDGISARMTADRTPGLRGTIAGQALDFGGNAAGGPDLSQSPGSLSGAGPGLLFGSGVEAQSRGMTMQEVLRGSSFSLTGEADGSGGTLSFWGGSPGSGGLVSGSRFAGNQRGDGTAVHLSGETGAALLGTDYARGRWLVGFALSQVRAEGGYASEGGSDCSGLPESVPASACAVAVQAGDGEVEASLTATIPYVALAVSERLRLWGAAGQGAGDVTVKTGSGGSYRADTAWSMAAAGLRGDLLAPPAPGSRSGAGSGSGSGTGPALALTSDALWVRTSSEKTGDLAASESDVSRLRVGLEGSWGVALSGGGSVTPKLELGARHDGGDAETGFGVELGGGLAWRDPKLGLTLDLSGRTLVAHDDGGLEDRGVSARLSYDPEPSSGRGLSLSLGQDWGGRSAGGLDALFQPEPLEDRAGSGGGHEATSRWGMEAAWGLPALGGRFTGSPYMGLGLATGARDYSLGWRLTPEAATAPGLSFGLRATRRESDTASPEHVLGIEATTRW